MSEVAKPPVLENKPTQQADKQTRLTSPFEGFGEETINGAVGIVANSFTPATEPPIHPDLFNRDRQPTELIKLPEPEKHTDAKQKISFLRPHRTIQRPRGMKERQGEQTRQQGLSKARAELKTLQQSAPAKVA
jgi:hypothetical protein